MSFLHVYVFVCLSNIFFCGFCFLLYLCLLFPLCSLLTLASVFLSSSVQLARDSAGAGEMDAVSIFRTREGGQTKSKLWRERERVRVEEEAEEEEGCEEEINLHSTSASGQRQLQLQNGITGKKRRLKDNKTNTDAGWFLKLAKREDCVDTTKDICKQVSVEVNCAEMLLNENAWDKNTLSTYFVVQPRAAAVEPFLDAVYQRLI